MFPVSETSNVGFPAIQVFKSNLARSSEELMFVLLAERWGFEEAVKMAKRDRMKCGRLIRALRKRLKPDGAGFSLNC
jgi:hypothetical protein